MEQRTRLADGWMDSRFEWQYTNPKRECVNMFVTQANIDMSFETAYITFRFHEGEDVYIANTVPFY